MQESILITLSKDDLKSLIQTSVNEAISDKFDNIKANNGDDLYTREGLMNWLDISYHSVLKLMKSGVIPYKRIGKRVFFSKQEVINALPSYNKQQ